MSDKHPAPWKWDWSVLMDASGKEILALSEEPEDGEPSASVRALIAAAPEMEALLRRLEWRDTETYGVRICPECFLRENDRSPPHRHAIVRGEPCRLGALLARIDGAK